MINQCGLQMFMDIAKKLWDKSIKLRKEFDNHFIIILNQDSVYLEQSLAETQNIDFQTRRRSAIPSESPAEFNYDERFFRSYFWWHYIIRTEVRFKCLLKISSTDLDSLYFLIQEFQADFILKIYCVLF